MENLNNEDKHSLVELIDIRVGRITEIKCHPQADSLYLEEVDFGESERKTVISGLVKYFSIDELMGRLCLFIFNMKPTKLRGVMSEAMILVAREKEDPEKLVLLSPPEDAVPGDKAVFTKIPEEIPGILNPKKKHLEKIMPHISTEAKTGRVLFMETDSLHIPGKGDILAVGIENGIIS